MPSVLPHKLQPTSGVAEQQASQDIVDEVPVEQTDKTFWQRCSPVIACGSGLFSDGYLNGVSGYSS